MCAPNRRAGLSVPLRMPATSAALTNMMAERDRRLPGIGWQGKETTLRLVWSLQRVWSCYAASSIGRVLLDRTAGAAVAQLSELAPDRSVGIRCVVTSLDAELLTLGHVVPRSGRCENGRRTEEPMGGAASQRMTEGCRLLAQRRLISSTVSLFVAW